MKGYRQFSRGIRRIFWGVSVLTGTLSMAAGIFAAGAVRRLRLWRVTRLVWVLPALWTAGGFLGVCRATWRLDRALARTGK